MRDILYFKLRIFVAAVVSGGGGTTSNDANKSIDFRALYVTIPVTNHGKYV